LSNFESAFQIFLIQSELFSDSGKGNLSEEGKVAYILWSVKLLFCNWLYF